MDETVWKVDLREIAFSNRGSSGNGAVNSVCFNDGSAGFTCEDVPTDAGDTYDVAVADLDGDGDPDLAFANAISNDQSRTNAVCFNDGAAAFTCEAVSPDTNHSRGVVAADFDGDGDADLVFVNEQFFTFGQGTGIERLCRNDGSGAFACEDLATSNDDTYDVAVGHFGGTPVSAEAPSAAPGRLALSVFPNPARAGTTLRLDLDAPEAVTVAVYDALGRRVAILHDGPMPAGEHRLTLDAAGLPSGVFVVRVSGASGTVSKWVTLVR